MLKQAENIYQPTNTTVTGHSLAGTIGAGIASKKDKLYAFNPGYTIGQKTRSKKGQQEVYRTGGDLVSILGSGSKNITNLPAPKVNLSDVIGGGLLGYTTKSHLDYNEVKDVII